MLLLVDVVLTHVAPVAALWHGTPLCTEDDQGYSTKVKLKYFMQYLVENRDDSPLYIFDSSFDEDGVGQRMLSSFTVPPYFRDDLFSLVGEARRPPYRWFLVGPERSGSNLHIDPLATSAWNTLLTGVKRWSVKVKESMA
jgi:histone arginine demethylase JMJD6